MAESDNGQEKTEQPTPKRLQEARDKGQVARSRELGTAGMLLAAAGMFLATGDSIIGGLMGLVTESLSIDRSDVFDPAAPYDRVRDAILAAVALLAPFFAVMVAVAIAGGIALGGWSFSTQGLAFKPEKMDPVKGMKKVFSARGLMEMIKSLAKFLLVAAVGVLLLQSLQGTLLGLGGEPVLRGLAHTGNILTWVFLVLSASLLLVVAFDVPFQLWDHQRQLKMTLQEVKEEFKQTEGSPEVKGRQRQIQMQMAQRRMMEDVPSADVVVTNPTHYAVALRYDQGEMDAPVVVAKGADLIAQQIRAIASEHDVPILSAPPLARSLFHSAELNEPIPGGLYRAVAQVLAYVYALRQGPVYDRSGDVALDDLPIPEELRRDE